MSALTDLLDQFRRAARTERERGTYFEELIRCYLRHEASYRDLYRAVWTYAEWARLQGRDGRDVGIDLVAETWDGDCHAIQCKLYAPEHRLQKRDLDSFFTASGQKPFVHRLIVSTAALWSEHAEAALRDQQPPVSRIDLFDLEASQIDWSRYRPDAPPTLKPKKRLREHQRQARERVRHGLTAADRGRLIMACGTGKTLTALKIAEALAGPGGRVLFLVPSLNLLSQTLTEWTQEAELPLHSFAVCSDSDVGKRRARDDDRVQTLTHELRYPATTAPDRLAAAVARRHDGTHLTVVFATYHSLAVLHVAQRDHGLPPFDLAICDEAHRTTGAIFDGEDESAFVRIHDADYLRAARRLYMTATPRIYGEAAKASAERDNVALCSMDDPRLYGPELFVLTFSAAVARGLLCDYKVLVLAIEEAHVSRRLQHLLKDPDNQLKVDDAARIVGCWKALSRQGLDEGDGNAPLRRAVAFCQVIDRTPGARSHQVSSKEIAGMFRAVVDAYRATADGADAATTLTCEAAHVDGRMSASEKEARLQWLKDDPPPDTCRLLSNVRCLAEGVDVPALDAVLFLTPRQSPVDVVQSVGRVMRVAPGKRRGYVILPVVIPAGVEPHAALDDNRTYRVVWQVLQALRSHDDRFDAMINKLDLIGRAPDTMEVIAVTDRLERRAPQAGETTGAGRFAIGEPARNPFAPPVQQALTFEIGEIERAIYAKLVQKVGNRRHWEDWANDIARIARTHIDRIAGILEQPANGAARATFDAFAQALRASLNDRLSDAEIVEMLAQHLVTQPVFEALFEGDSFASRNPISRAMRGVLAALHEHRLDQETDTLAPFYASVKLRAAGIDNAAGKQRIVVELYDKFFRNAFPRLTERLGIVYTPVEVVDFIVRSVNDLLESEFGASLGAPGVHILDPFTGTGTFIARLLDSGLIPPERLPDKYRHELHANEIVLLAYYIAAINIEAVYHGQVGGAYEPFAGICLTDTFQMREPADLVERLLEDNNARRRRQQGLEIRVILGNPPYSVGQEDANDNNANLQYPFLDRRIRETYAEQTSAQNKNGLYNSYIRAMRWASDRIGKSGIIGFVTNAGWIDGVAGSGLRKCLADEFSDLYIFHLRGNQRSSGELSRKEGGKIFGSGSRAPIAISLLVKNPATKQRGRIYFHDIGDYLSREDKLEKIAAYGSIAGITAANGWRAIVPDAHGDWLKQRDDRVGDFIVLGDKENPTALKLFANYSNGVKTQRDAWCYNSSRSAVADNMARMIDFYNREVRRFDDAHVGLDRKAREAVLDEFINTDPTQISWTHNIKHDLAKNRHLSYENESLIASLYRPFTKQWLYYSRDFNERVYKMPSVFPSGAEKNIVICVSAPGFISGFTALVADVPPELCVAAMKGGTQCFPRYLYDDPAPAPQGGLFDHLTPPRQRRDAIADAGLAHFQAAYPGEPLTKDDLFYYVYGLLHSPDYRARYADNLAKELPRLPRVARAADFWAFAAAGRALAALHLHYETVAPYPATLEGDPGDLPPAAYRVEKMRHGKRGADKDLTTIHYNARITVRDIPPDAYDYVVNGKSAIDWVMERQGVKTDKASGIVNDANAWAIDTMRNPRYPLELLLRVIAVSLETNRIVAGLPALDIHPEERRQS